MTLRILFLGETALSGQWAHTLRTAWPGEERVRVDLVHASSLREACMHLYAVPFDCVLLDLEGDAVRRDGVVERIRELDPDVPVVASCAPGEAPPGATGRIPSGVSEARVWACILDAVRGAVPATHEHQA